MRKRSALVRFLVPVSTIVFMAWAIPAHAQIARVQAQSGVNDGAGGNVSATWSPATTAGNLLVAVVAGNGYVTITPPTVSGTAWTNAVYRIHRKSREYATVAIYYIGNANSQSGASTWTVSGSNGASLVLLEYSGIVTDADPLDRIGFNGGKAKYHSTGWTAQTQQAEQVLVGALTHNGNSNYGAPGNSFTEITEVTSSGSYPNECIVGERFVSAIGSFYMNASITGAKKLFAGAIATFRAPPPTRYWVSDNPVAQIWADNNNWSTTSNGAPSASYPVTGFLAIFDGGGTGPCTPNADVSAVGIDVQSTYPSTLTQGGNTFTLGPNGFSQAGGTFSGGTAELTVDGQYSLSGTGAFTSTSTRMTVNGNFTYTAGTFSHNSGTVLLNAPADRTFTPPPTGQRFNNLILNDGMQGYWRLDETSGTQAADVSGNSLPLTYGGGPVQETSGLPSLTYRNPACLRFDGTDDYASQADSANLLSSVPITISFFMKSNGAVATNDGIMAKTNAAWTQGWGFYFGSASQINFYVEGTGNLAYFNTTHDGSFSTQNWNHVVGTWNGVDVQIYVNGTQGTDDLEGYTGSITGGNPFEIGRLNSDSYNFNGWIDDVRIYKRSLLNSEIYAMKSGYAPQAYLSTQTLAGGLFVSGDLTLASGNLDVSTSNYGVTAARDWLNYGARFSPRGGTVTLEGTGTRTLRCGTNPFYNLSLAAAGTWSQEEALYLDGSYSQSAGTFTSGSTGYAITVKGGLTLSGTSAFTATTGRMEVGGAVTKDSGATFTANGGTFYLNSGTNRTLSSGGATFNDVTINDGLVGHWKLGDTTREFDYSPYGVEGSTFQAVADTDRPSIFSGDSAARSLSFDGVDDYTYVGNYMNTGGPVTVSFWNKVATADVRDSSVFGVGQNAAATVFQADAPWSDNRLYFDYGEWYVDTDANGKLDGEISTDYTSYLDGWHHIALVSEGIGGAFKGIYIDGALVASDTGRSDGPHVALVGGLYVGWWYGYHKGKVDDFRMYNRRLSATEISNLYNGVALSSASTQTLSGSLDVNGNFQLRGGTLDLSSSDMTVGGHWFNYAGTFTPQSRTATFDGTVGQMALTGGTATGKRFYNLTVANTGDPASKAVTAGGDLYVTNALAVSSGRFDIDAPRLEGLWRMDEESGTTAADSSGNGNHATLVNSPTPSSGVPPNPPYTASNPQCLVFNGTTQYLSVPNFGNFPVVTVSAWVYRTGNTGARETVVSYKEANTVNEGFVLSLNEAADDTHYPRMWVNVDGTRQYAEYASTVALDTWVHLAGTYDGTSIKLYVDGTLQATAVFPGLMKNTGSEYTGIGVRASLDGYYFPGRLDDARIYSRALSASEIGTVRAGNVPTGGAVTATVASASVASGAELRLKGVADGTRNATLTSSSSYNLTLTGTMQARYFVLDNLGASGVVVNNGATLRDLDFGELNKANGVSGPALDLSAVTGQYRDRIPYSFEELSFTEDTSDVATNVKARSTTPIVRFFGKRGSSDNGAVWGEADEDDVAQIAGFGLGRIVWHTGALRRMTAGSETATDASYDTLHDAFTANGGAARRFRWFENPVISESFDVDLYTIPAAGPAVEGGTYLPMAGMGTAFKDGDRASSPRVTVRNAVVGRGGLDEVTVENCTVFRPSTSYSALSLTNSTATNAIYEGGTTTTGTIFTTSLSVATASASTYFASTAMLDFHLLDNATTQANALDRGTGLSSSFTGDMDGNLLSVIATATRPQDVVSGDQSPAGDDFDIGADELVKNGSAAVVPTYLAGAPSGGIGMVGRILTLGTRKRADLTVNGDFYAYLVTMGGAGAASEDNKLWVVNYNGTGGAPEVTTSIALAGPAHNLTWWKDGTGNDTVWIHAAVDTDSDGYADAIQAILDRGGSGAGGNYDGGALPAAGSGLYAVRTFDYEADGTDRNLDQEINEDSTNDGASRWAKDTTTRDADASSGVIGRIKWLTMQNVGSEGRRLFFVVGGPDKDDGKLYKVDIADARTPGANYGKAVWYKRDRPFEWRSPVTIYTSTTADLFVSVSAEAAADTTQVVVKIPGTGSSEPSITAGWTGVGLPAAPFDNINGQAYGLNTAAVWLYVAPSTDTAFSVDMSDVADAKRWTADVGSQTLSTQPSKPSNSNYVTVGANDQMHKIRDTSPATLDADWGTSLNGGRIMTWPLLVQNRLYWGTEQGYCYAKAFTDTIPPSSGDETMVTGFPYVITGHRINWVFRQSLSSGGPTGVYFVSDQGAVLRIPLQ
jgi:hypothetical protein